MVKGRAWAIVITTIFVAALIVILISLTCQPQNTAEVSFKVSERQGLGYCDNNYIWLFLSLTCQPQNTAEVSFKVSQRQGLGYIVELSMKKVF